MAKINSNKPFKGKPNLRAGAGPVYNKFKPLTNIADNKVRGTLVIKEPCYGPYDNLVRYVFEVDLSNGDHLAYVDCDYVG